MKRNRLRPRRYGLGHITYGLVALACLGVAIGVSELALRFFDDADTAYLTGLLSMFPVFGCLIVLEWRLTDRQIAEDLERAKADIRRPLRNVVFGNQEPIDFDPHFATVTPNGRMVRALDPRRRSMRYILCNWIGPDGRTWDDGGPIEGIITHVAQTTVLAKRRWFGLLPARETSRAIELAVTALDGGKETTLRIRFRPDDRAIDGWRRTFEQWMRDDQQKTGNPVDA